MNSHVTEGCRDFRRRTRLSRRGFLQFGALSPFALSMPQYLQAVAAADSPEPVRAKSAILVWLDGGPTHHDTFDPKPDAPADIRGEYSTTQTKVPGVRFADSIPLLAGQMQRISIIRSMTHRQSAHEPGKAFMVSGYEFRPGHNFPSIGSVVGFESQQRSQQNGLPPYVAIPNERIRGGGHLGASYNPLSIPGDPNAADFHVQDLIIPRQFSKDRFLQRRALSAALSAEFRESRVSDVTRSVDKYTRQAYEMIMSSKSQAALNLKLEDAKTRDRYGRSTFGQRMLLARRLVESGVPFVTAGGFEWDDHRNIFPKLKEKLPVVDRALSALVADLDERGLLDTTLVVVAGEFGRTPKINVTGGRDHWSQVFSVMIAGAGVHGGRVIGASDDKGELPKDRPVTPQEMFHSMYVLLGIDPHKFLKTTSGRDIQIVRDGKFIDELTA